MNVHHVLTSHEAFIYTESVVFILSADVHITAGFVSCELLR